MTDSSTDLAWTCPSCARRVPRRVAECRCGFQQADVPLKTEQVVETGVQSDKRGYGLAIIGGIVLVAGALVMIPMRTKSPVPERASQPAPASTLPAAPQGESAAQISGTPTSSVPGLAADVTVSALPEAPAPAVAAPVTSAVTMSIEDVASQVVPAVVSIEAGQARGTGFHVRPDVVLTNAHVVEGHSSVRLHYSGNIERTGRVMNIASGSDLAVVQVYNADPQQPTLTLGSVNSARVGQEVIAVGSALGVLSNTVTRGIVSAVRRVGEVTLIQTDAAINPGNSGGPLVNRSGRVIGVNSLAVSKGVAESLAFAVAIDHAAQLLSGQGSLTAQTPLAGLNQMMGGGAASERDQRRERGEQIYEKTLEWASQNADRLDSSWQQYAKSCVASSLRGGDRAWFAVFEPNGIRLTGYSGYDCGGWLNAMRTNAEAIKSEVDKAAEVARQSGVYPGVMRDVRRRHRMEWSGWER